MAALSFTVKLDNQFAVCNLQTQIMSKVLKPSTSNHFQEQLQELGTISLFGMGLYAISVKKKVR